MDNQVSAGQDHSNSNLHLTRPNPEAEANDGNYPHDEARVKSESSSKLHRQSGIMMKKVKHLLLIQILRLEMILIIIFIWKHLIVQVQWMILIVN